MPTEQTNHDSRRARFRGRSASDSLEGLSQVLADAISDVPRASDMSSDTAPAKPENGSNRTKAGERNRKGQEGVGSFAVVTWHAANVIKNLAPYLESLARTLRRSP